MQKQIKIYWGRMDIPNERYILTLPINKDPNRPNFYSTLITTIENHAYMEAHNMGLATGRWDLNRIYDEIDANPNLFKEDETIYIREGFDEEIGNQHNPNIEFPFNNARLEYFIPASNNNDSSDDDVMSDGFVVGGGKRKRNRTRHTFVGKKVLPLPPQSHQSKFYKNTKANIEKATANFLSEEKIRQNASLTYTPSEENFLLEATKATKGGSKFEVNTNVKVYWRNIDGTYSPHIAKITEINNNEITLTFKTPRYIWRGDPNTATDEKGNKLIEKIQREFPPIPKKGGRKSRTKKRKSSKKRTKSLFKKKRTKKRRKKRRKKRGYGGKSPKRTKRRGKSPKRKSRKRRR